MCESHTVYVGMQSVSPSLDCGTVFMLNFATFIHADSDSVQRVYFGHVDCYVGVMLFALFHVVRSSKSRFGPDLTCT